MKANPKATKQSSRHSCRAPSSLLNLFDVTWILDVMWSVRSGLRGPRGAVDARVGEVPVAARAVDELWGDGVTRVCRMQEIRCALPQGAGSRSRGATGARVRAPRARSD
jgi:hypothetical protein